MKALDRRALLQGMIGGALVSIALPPLAAMMNGNGTAYAGASSFPKRFGVWFWGNGILPHAWVPSAEGAAWELPPIMAPLAAVRDRLLVVSGTRVATLNTTPHEAGPAGLLTGDQPRNGTMAKETLDQAIALAIGSDTRFRSLEAGVQKATGSLSHTGPGLMNPCETDPHALFQRLFGGGVQQPGATADPRLGLRPSLLDAVRGQALRLRAKVGVEDRRRLDQHLEGIFALERQLQRQAVSLSCAPGAAPPEDLPDRDGRPAMHERSRLMSELLTLALSCDQTRVFFQMYSQPINNTLFGTAPAGHHQLTHDEPGEQPIVLEILQSIMADLAGFIAALGSVREGDGTLLDNTIILATTDCSFGRNHSLDEYPILLAGGGALGLKQGFHLRARDDNASRVSLALLQTFGVRANEFGVGPGRVTEPLTGMFV
ncbi:MAG: DUF1552 domain-containing protein [Deltaproteobacteria bacterium]|nr:DUF1552 domain-containing protein [Deltaproteobacteria bacterium]